MIPSDDEIKARRAQIDVHCGGCGHSFPGDSRELTNGLCRECRRKPHRLMARLERYEAALRAIADDPGVRTLGDSIPMAARLAAIARRALKGIDHG